MGRGRNHGGSHNGAASQTLPMQDEATRPAIHSLPEVHFRRNVIALVLDERHRMLMLLRTDREGWQAVQGGIEARDEKDGTQLLRAAARELYEEAGILVAAAEFDQEEGPQRFVLTVDEMEADGVAEGAPQRRAPRSEAEQHVPGAPPIAASRPVVRYVGVLPLTDEEAPLRHWFPVGCCLSHVRRGIYGQQQQCLVFATSNGESLIARLGLRGLAGQRREFMGARWQPIADAAGVAMTVPPCKVDVFAVIVRALGRALKPAELQQPQSDATLALCAAAAEFSASYSRAVAILAQSA